MGGRGKSMKIEKKNNKFISTISITRHIIQYVRVMREKKRVFHLVWYTFKNIIEGNSPFSYSNFCYSYSLPFCYSNNFYLLKLQIMMMLGKMKKRKTSKYMYARKSFFCRCSLIHAVGFGIGNGFGRQAGCKQELGKDMFSSEILTIISIIV